MWEEERCHHKPPAYWEQFKESTRKRGSGWGEWGGGGEEEEGGGDLRLTSLPATRTWSTTIELSPHALVRTVEIDNFKADKTSQNRLVQIMLYCISSRRTLDFLNKTFKFLYNILKLILYLVFPNGQPDFWSKFTGHMSNSSRQIHYRSHNKRALNLTTTARRTR